MATKTRNSKPETQNSAAAAAGTQTALGVDGEDWAADKGKVANISDLHRATGMDRSTIVKRLDRAGVRHKFKRAKETFYDEAEAMAVLSLSGRQAETPAPLTQARTHKTTAEAARIVLKLKQEQGELAPRSEFREEAFNLVKAVHTRYTRYAKEARRRFKLTAEQARQMETDFALIFDDLKRDYPDVL
jgi:hypothetical protein